MGAKYGDLEKLQESLKELEKEHDIFLEACVKELAARLLRKVIKRTPVRKPENCPPGVKGGTLRRGWTSMKDIKVQKRGSNFIVEIKNPTEYASYVEYGHRTRGGKGWVKGRFMLTLSEQELERSSQAIIERKLKKWLGGVF